jgi:hypothetical protein
MKMSCGQSLCDIFAFFASLREGSENLAQKLKDAMEARSRVLATAVFLLLILCFSPSINHPNNSTVRAQGDPLQALTDEYAQLESTGLKENFHRQLSYAMLQPYLPPGTRLTSGYRAPEKQLDLILRMARANGIAAPASGTVDDEASWRPALAGLRAKGFIVAAPTTTPHGTDEAVFDLSGADLNAIQAGLRRAETAGMVKYKRIIFEARNNAVHVEVESISPKALNVLGQRRSTSATATAPNSTTTTGGSPSSTGIAPPSGSENDQRGGMLRQLQDLHDGEPDPAKKIDYDRSIKNLLDPAADAAKIAALDAEIKQHQIEGRQLATEGEKKILIDKVSEALREERYEDAERDAQQLVKKFPGKDSQQMFAQIRTRRLIMRAMSVLETQECAACQEAEGLIARVFKLSPDHDGARILKEDVDACLGRCGSSLSTTTFVALLSLLVLLTVGSVGGWYVWTQHGGARLLAANPVSFTAGAAREDVYVLEGIGGACYGQAFTLGAGETVIGSKGAPDGPADVVILDPERKISRRHCLITRNGKQIFITDDSTNGTTLNNQPLTRGVPSELREGDRISLSDVAMLALKNKGVG